MYAKIGFHVDASVLQEEFADEFNVLHAIVDTPFAYGSDALQVSCILHLLAPESHVAVDG